MSKLLLLGLLASLPILIIFGYYVVHLLSVELDSRFYTAVDAIPTKVYSRVFWIKPTKLLSLSELRSRLKERSYAEVQEESQLVQGSYIIREPEAEQAKIFIFLKNFVYPQSVEKLFFSEKNVGVEKQNYFEIDWEAGEIKRIVRKFPQQNEEEIDGVALEPVLIAQLNSNDKETRETIPLNEIPYTLLQAIVSVEDQRFLEHSGVDPKGILRSIWVNVRAGQYQQGASTITQQMVRNIYLSRSKTMRRKIKEMIMAIMIELKYSKDQILEKYLNEVYFGQLGNLEIRGVSQAAKYYFGKSVQSLSIAEQALLAALIRGPFYYSPTKYFDRAKQRQELVLQKMLEGGVITKETHELATKEKLVFAEVSNILDKAPYFTDFVKAQLLKEIPDEELMGVGYQIYSTLDTYFQHIVETNVESGILELEKNLKKRVSSKKAKAKNIDPNELTPLQGAFILVDPTTNNLLSIVGGKSYKESNYNRALYMRRQVGSVVKPFVFLAALLYGTNSDGSPMNAVTKMEDAPFKYKYDKQVWEPRNYEPGYEGMVTLRYALANSLNIPTARLATIIGIDKVVQVLHAAGVDMPLEALPSLSLGAVEIPPIMVAKAYATLANMGVKKDITSILAITNSEGEPVAQFVQEEEQALPTPEVANIVEMLRSVFSIGTARSAKDYGFRYPAVGKTGTTNDYRDSWFAGFTSQLLGLSWVGYDRDNEGVLKQRNLQKLTGALGALPVWAAIMRDLHGGLPERNIHIPEDSVEKLQVDIISGGRVTDQCKGNNVITEIFTKRNAPQFACPSN